MTRSPAPAVVAVAVTVVIAALAGGVARAQQPVGPPPRPVAPSPPAPAPPAPPAPKLRILVLPLAPSPAIDASIARAFDARLLVALDDTRRVVTLTPTVEPECTTTVCLADLGTAAGGDYVLAVNVLREPGGLTLFGTLVQSSTATPVRRAEVGRLGADALARTGPLELVPQLVGAAPGPIVLGLGRVPTSAFGRVAVLALHDRLSDLRTFRVLPLDGGGDRTAMTHRADLVLDDLDVVDRRRGLCTWHDGTLVGTFTITELATARIVFSRTARIVESQRALTSNRENVLDAMLEAAVADWISAFRAAGGDAVLRRRPALAPAPPRT